MHIVVICVKTTTFLKKIGENNLKIITLVPGINPVIVTYNTSFVGKTWIAKIDNYAFKIKVFHS
jgi:2-hydroxy-3-keto-5-methylthiopentenyl-1-phosphate phosphatase